jgi:hypothetical protein
LASRSARRRVEPLVEVERSREVRENLLQERALLLTEGL